MSIPDPDPPDDPPAEAIPPFTERPPAAEIWRRARQDFLGGDSAAVVAERYGLSERSVRRHAADEGWRRADVSTPHLADAPPWGVRYYQAQHDIIADHPEYDAIAAARHQDQFNLLFTPEPDDLKGFAFRRACEAAALNRPSEAAAWLRVQRLTTQCGHIPNPQADAFSPDDHMRAAMLRAMHGGPPDTPAAAPDPTPDAQSD